MERIQVLVCAGTGCSIGNSSELVKRFEEEIRSFGLENEISVKKTGCLGLCGFGPNVAIYPDNIIYKTVKLEDVPEIVREHFYKGRPVKRLMIDDGDHVQEEIYDVNKTRFYAKQKRVALKDCGVIDPEKIEEYIA